MITKILENHNSMIRNHALVYGFVVGGALSAFVCYRSGHSVWDNWFMILRHAVEMSLHFSLAGLFVVYAELIIEQNFAPIKPTILMAYLAQSNKV